LLNYTLIGQRKINRSWHKKLSKNQFSDSKDILQRSTSSLPNPAAMQITAR